jgi:hypothetical protein
MSIAKQQNAILVEAKQVFGDVISRTVDMVSVASPTFAQEISDAVKAAILHIQNEYGYAIAFYIANDFQNHMNSNPNGLIKLDMEFTYAFDAGVNPLAN